MGNARKFFVSFTIAVLFVFFNMYVWAAEEKIAVVHYELKPIEAVDSGRNIKAEWNAKIWNRSSEPVRFSLTILFIDSNDDILDETTFQHELNAQETKSFKDTMLIEASIANKIASTRATVKETTEAEASP